MTIDLTTIAVFALAVALLGLSKGGLAGIGMMAMPMLLLVMPPATAAGLMLPVLMTQDALTIWIYRGKWDIWNLKILIPGALLGIAIGFVSFAIMPGAGAALPARRGDACLRPARASRRQGAGARAASGGRRLPRRGVGLHLDHPAPGRAARFRSTCCRNGCRGTSSSAPSVIFFGAVNLIKLPGFIALGQLTQHNLTIALIAAPWALFMTWVGSKIVRRIEVERFYIIIHWLLALVGVKLLSDALL